MILIAEPLGKGRAAVLLTGSAAALPPAREKADVGVALAHPPVCEAAAFAEPPALELPSPAAAVLILSPNLQADVWQTQLSNCAR